MNPLKFALAVPGLALASLASLAACGLALNGLEPEGNGNGNGDSAPPNTVDAPGDASDGGGANDTGAAATTDALTNDSSPVDGCTPTGQENCVNGLDDDCNGLVDCADPACTTTGYACVDAPPAGWAVAPFSATSRPGCPPALPAQADVDVDPTNLTGVTTCDCTCNLGAPPSCVQGDLQTRYGPDDACDGGNGAGTLVNYPTNDGGCTPMQNVVIAPFVLAEQPPLSGGSCTATPTVSSPPTGATEGQVCGGQSAFGSGCSDSQVCALVPSGYGTCILHSGAAACPSGPYGTPHTVGTIDDTRGCTKCSCNPPSANCAPGSWTFFASANCSGPPAAVIPTNDQCTGTGAPPAGTPVGSNQFASAISDITCATPAPVTATGSVQLTGANTVCCE